jgi:hypothetical protein
MGLTDWMLKKQLNMQSTLRNKFRDALRDDMKKYQKKHNGQKPTVDEVVHEFEKNSFVLAQTEKYYGLTLEGIRSIVKEVLNG